MLDQPTPGGWTSAPTQLPARPFIRHLRKSLPNSTVPSILAIGMVLVYDIGPAWALLLVFALGGVTSILGKVISASKYFVALGVLIFASIFCLVAILFDSFLIPMAFFAATVGQLLFNHWIINLGKASDEDIKLLEETEDTSIALVEAEIRGDYKYVGSDRGILWIADDLIHFKGHYCYFAFSGEDCFVTTLPSPRFGLRKHEVCIDVSFDPLRWSGDPKGDRAKRIIQQAVALAKSAVQSTQPRVYPPTEKLSDAVKRLAIERQNNALGGG